MSTSVSSLSSMTPDNTSVTHEYIATPARKGKARPTLLVNSLSSEEILMYDTDTFQTNHFLAPLTSFQINQNPDNLNGPDDMNETNEGAPGSASEQTDLDAPSNLETKTRPYACDKCGKSFHLKHHLTSHEKTHTGIRPHACEHCGKTFTHKHCLNTHLLLHSSQRPYECAECKKRFTLKHHLISHGRVHNRDKPFVCENCGIAFALKRHLVTHSKFHAGKRPFVCKECGESFTQKHQLVMHSRFHGSVNSYVCNDCGESFTRKFELVAHSRVHGKVPHKCGVCNKEFLQKRTLITHLKEHSKEFSHVCEECGNIFNSQDELDFHIKLHPYHKMPNEQQPDLDVSITEVDAKLQCMEEAESLIACEGCGCSFRSREELAFHEKMHCRDTIISNSKEAVGNLNSSHVQVKAGDKEKNYICTHCSKGFARRQGLLQHLKRRPEGLCALTHVCSTCNKTFQQKNHLVLHEKLHINASLRNDDCILFYLNIGSKLAEEKNNENVDCDNRDRDDVNSEHSVGESSIDNTTSDQSV